LPTKVVLPKGGDVTRLTVHEYTVAVRQRYQAAGKKEKGKILEEFCAATGMLRMAVTRLLRQGIRLAPGTEGA
jgi:hypothetical protein